jgi:hypothetical protein
MKKQTQSLSTKPAAQKAGDEPTLTIALWVIGGLILFAAVIFAVATGHL